LELFSFDRPIVAAVSGHSIALGLFVTCSADYRIAIDGQYVCQANEVRNNMDIPTQIMEILKARVNKNYFYPAVFHADAYSVQDSIAVGYIDEVVPEDKFMDRVMEKAAELATLPHPFYANTKKSAQEDVRSKISDAIEKYENLVDLN
jgi:enoyl-CoA hydratase